MQDQLRQGIIEAVPAGETPPRATHYLPHHAIVCWDKYTTKVRVVYDASAKSATSPSINDCLLKGQKFNQLIFDDFDRTRQLSLQIWRNRF